jgi:lysophospholipase
MIEGSMLENSSAAKKLFTEEEKGEILAYYDAVSESRVFEAHDGTKIHYSQIIHPENKKLLVILPGRTEPSAKYAEMAYDLRDEGYDIFIVDHRGQGYSDRMLENRKIGHVENFLDYVVDLEEASRLIVRVKKYERKMMLAHSMGTIVGLLHAERNPMFWDGLILGSPMLEIKTRTFPQWFVENLFSILKGVGKGDEFIPMGNPDQEENFETNTVTHCPDRYRMARYIEEREPKLHVSEPSSNWVLEGFKASQMALERRHVLKMPILMFQAGLDDYVHEDAQNEFCSTLKNCKKVYFKDAYHEIFQEKDSIRNKAIKEIKKFLK